MQNRRGFSKPICMKSAAHLRLAVLPDRQPETNKSSDQQTQSKLCTEEPKRNNAFHNVKKKKAAVNTVIDVTPPTESAATCNQEKQNILLIESHSQSNPGSRDDQQKKWRRDLFNVKSTVQNEGTKVTPLERSSETIQEKNQDVHLTISSQATSAVGFGEPIELKASDDSESPSVYDSIQGEQYGDFSESLGKNHSKIELPPGQSSVVVLYTVPHIADNGNTTENDTLADLNNGEDLHFQEITGEQTFPSNNEYALDFDDFETSAVDTTPEKILTRKRKGNKSKWKQEEAKMKLNNGEEHLSVSGKVRRGRELKPPCFKECIFKCTSNLTENDRQEIFRSFWAIPTHARKWDFIGVHVSQYEQKNSTVNGVSKRQNSRTFSFKVQGRKIRVCKTMFLSTLHICNGWITTALKKLDKGTGTISPDKRGNNKKPPKPEKVELKESVREHIRGLPRTPSHYTRATSNKEYLTEDISSIADMHSLYENWMLENHPGKIKATYRQYADIFNSDFNISFFIAKKDQCDECVRWENASETEKEDMKLAFDQHILNKDLAQTMRIGDIKVAQLRSSKTFDNCVGQNKNRGVAAMYLHAAAKFKIHTRHRFLEKGHTWNAADNVHSLIERRVKNHDIYSPQEYYEKIAIAKRNKKNPIQVIEVQQGVIFDWKDDLASKLNLDIPWTKIREISVGETEHELKYRIQLNEENNSHSSKGVGRPVNLSNFVPKLVFSGPRPISKAKYKDLVEYCDKGFIPAKYHDFYKSLTSGDVPDEAPPEELTGRARKRKAPEKKKSSGKKSRAAADDDPDDDFD
ncbi:hypothetical protein FOCC_FOCC010982 [Frankliniella occidentalis]|nr:hypothetical protein FOCC_FOCC010982 [Frankliniella occidentalis]